MKDYKRSINQAQQLQYLADVSKITSTIVKTSCPLPPPIIEQPIIEEQIVEEQLIIVEPIIEEQSIIEEQLIIEELIVEEQPIEPIEEIKVIESISLVKKKKNNDEQQ